MTGGPLDRQLRLDDVEIPALVVELAAGRVVEPVWRNEIGGVTFRLGGGPDADHLKVGPPDPEQDVEAVAERLGWVAAHVVAPTPLAWGRRDGVEWLLTRGIPGTSAVGTRERPESFIGAVDDVGRADFGTACRADSDAVGRDRAGSTGRSHSTGDGGAHSAGVSARPSGPR